MKNKNKRKRYQSPLSFSESDSQEHDFPSVKSFSKNMSFNPVWGSSSSSDSESEDQEFDDLSNYLPRWPVTGRRGRRSTIAMREKQVTEGKKSVLESERIGKKGGYLSKTFTTDERGCKDGYNGVSEKEKTLLEKGKGKPVIEPDDDSDNSSSTILREELPVSSKYRKIKIYKNKHEYFLEEKPITKCRIRSTSPGKSFQKSRDPTDHTRFPSNGTKEASISPTRSTQTYPKVFFDLNDLPPIEDEDDDTKP